MTSSNTEVIPAKTSATSAEAADVSSAKAADVATTKTTHATSAETTDVTSAKATTVSAATATAAAGLCARGSKAAGNQHTCQNRYQSSSHDLSPLGWADVPPQDLRQMSACLS